MRGEVGPWPHRAPVTADRQDGDQDPEVGAEVANTHDTPRQATSQVFDDWIRELAGYHEACGIPRPAARETASSVIALLERAFMLGRAARSTAPVHAAGRAAAAIVSAAPREG